MGDKYILIVQILCWKQDGVELLSQDMDMVSEDEVVSQEDAAEPESMVENLDMEDAVGDDEEDEDDDLITVEENVSSSQGMSSDCSGTGRGPHTPPGPAPGSPPDTELEQDFSEQYSAGTDLEQQFEELAEQVIALITIFCLFDCFQSIASFFFSLSCQLTFLRVFSFRGLQIKYFR